MRIFKQQIIPIFLTMVTFFLLVVILYLFVNLLNLLPNQEKIVPQFIIAGILVGLTIYLKTSVDFAIFIGNLMSTHPGTRNRIAIEIGTALGNGIGTLLVLAVWTFFKEIPVLMIFMIFLASLVLLRMAQDGLKESRIKNQKLRIMIEKIYLVLSKINSIFDPLIKFILPHPSIKSNKTKSFIRLLFFAASIPFILGLDDFAGYIPLFSIVNVLSFSVGVFLGHMLLNVSLFASPGITVKIVKLPVVAFLGSLAFLGIALFGFFEIWKIIFTL